MAIPNKSLTPPASSRAQTYSKVFKVALIVFAFFVVFLIFLVPFSGDKINYEEADFVQLEEPDDDATVVVFETTEGTFKAVLYEDKAPKYCEYFKKLVKDGYFDDTYVCSILRNENGDNAGFIGGSKTKDGLANDDSNTKMTKIEVSADLLPIKGSLCSLVKQGGIFTKSKAGSVITFLNDVSDDEQLDKNLEENGDHNGLGRVTEVFKKHGGVPNYLQMYTIFGQVYDGWDVIEKISLATIVDEGVSDDEEGKNYQPVNEIKFKKVYLSTYGKQKENGYVIPTK
ncbi:MAG: peptidylprolyl isomerase [Oscillospiraceae bacterium]|nr:peptidylprolyl isomerase [Oscillospiraceae bacterium]